jgi:hypothetical protein
LMLCMPNNVVDQAFDAEDKNSSGLLTQRAHTHLTL